MELEIVCENGSIRMVGNLVTTELDGKTETKDFSSGTVFGKDYWGSGHGFLIEDYYTRLAAGERFPVSGEEAIVSTRLLHAVYSSAKITRSSALTQRRIKHEHKEQSRGGRRKKPITLSSEHVPLSYRIKKICSATV